MGIRMVCFFKVYNTTFSFHLFLSFVRDAHPYPSLNDTRIPPGTNNKNPNPKTHFETHLKAPLPSTRTLPTPSLNKPTNFSNTFFPKNNRLVAGSLDIRVEIVDADQARSEGEVEVSFWRTGRSCC